jgi:hypothetical protein
MSNSELAMHRRLFISAYARSQVCYSRSKVASVMLRKLTWNDRRVEEMAKELETLRNQREDNGFKSTVSPDTDFDSPEYALEQSGTAVVTDFGIKEKYQLEDFVIDKNTATDMIKM